MSQEEILFQLNLLSKCIPCPIQYYEGDELLFMYPESSINYASDYIDTLLQKTDMPLPYLYTDLHFYFGLVRLKAADG